MKGNFNDIINSESLVLVDFYATWCGPCKMLMPLLDELANEVKGNARIIKIDVDKNEKIAQQYQVRGVPTLILFKNGKPVWRQSGLATKKQLLSIINQNK